MRCSNSIKVDGCNVFKETSMVQNTRLLFSTRRRTEHVNSYPIIYRATKPPRLYPVTEKRMTWSPLHSRSLMASVTLYLSRLIKNSSLQALDCKDLPLSQSVHLPNPLRHMSNYLLWTQPSIREELSHLIQHQNMFHERCVLTLLCVLGCPTFRE